MNETISLERLAITIVCVVTSSVCIAAEPATQPTSRNVEPENLQEIAIQRVPQNNTEAAELEARLKQNPDDAGLHARLSYYYFQTQFTSPAARSALREHVLWMIRNHAANPFSGTPMCRINPAFDPDGYIAVRDLWMQQVNAVAPPPIILNNAAQFLSLNDPKQAESLLKRAVEADPNNPQWVEQLAHLQSLNFKSPNATPATNPAKEAFGNFERAYQLSKAPDDRFYRLTDLPMAAYEAGDYAKAKSYADQLLIEAERQRRDWNYGNAVFKAHIALGRVALSAGDVGLAKTELLAAGKTPGSPQLDSFGPNMTLARDLLARGEKQAVLEYFDLCGKFWEMGAAQLKSWSNTVQSGGTPDFGASLSY